MYQFYIPHCKGRHRDRSSKVGMATGISCPPAGLGSEKAPGAWGVFQDRSNSQGMSLTLRQGTKVELVEYSPLKNWEAFDLDDHAR
jgi:hypothetical protein